MKRRSTLLSLLLATICGIGGIAQDAPYSKMSPHTRILLDQWGRKDTAGLLLRSAVSGEYLSAFVEVETEEAWAELESAGCRIRTRTGDIATVSIPMSQVEALSERADVRYISAARPMRVSMDSARYYSNVADAYAGKNLPHPYTGKGVVVGVVDGGFDYTHPNFYDKEGKTYRLKRVWDQRSPFSHAVYTTESDILKYACSYDSDEETHGTHVMGIAAGGGYDTPYQGVAYESDMMAVAAATEDTDIVNGVEYIFQESEREGKPCVVNLSLGVAVGAHDGTYLFDRMLDRLTGPGKIVVAAMGNYGDEPIYVELMSPADTLRTFADGDSPLTVDLWGDEPGEPFSVCLDIYDTEKREFLESTGFFSVDTLRKNKDFTFGVDSMVYKATVSAGLSPFNGKYEVKLEFSYPEGARKLDFGIQVATEGTPVRGWAFEGLFKDNGLSPRYTAGSSDFSIASSASARNVISVGAYATRVAPVNIEGKPLYRPNIQAGLGNLCPFSSVGPTVDGRMKPEVTAPGSWVISSYNSFYLEGEAGAKNLQKQVYYTDFKGREYPWGYMSGTSTACPFVTGTIALWLQANPTLTPDDIKEVIARTAIQDQPGESYPNNRWGWGKIDAYKGLLDVLGIATSSEHIFEERPEEAVSVYAGGARGRFHIRWAKVPGAFNVQVYDASGRRVHGEKVDAPASADFPVSLGDVPADIYFVRIETAEGAVDRKIRL